MTIGHPGQQLLCPQMMDTHWVLWWQADPRPQSARATLSRASTNMQQAMRYNYEL